MLIAAVCAVSALVFMAAMVKSDYESTIREAQQRDMVLAQMVEEHARRAFDLSRAALSDLADEVGTEGPPEASRAFITRANKILTEAPQIYGLWLFDERGFITYTTGTQKARGVSFADRAYFQAPADGQDFYIGGLTLSRVEPFWFFSLSKRLVDGNGVFRGVLVAAMRLDYFGGLYARLGLAPDDNMGIYTTDGTVVARRLINWAGPDIPSIKSYPLFTTYLHESPMGVLDETSPIDIIERVGAYRSVQGWPLVVASTSDKRQVLAPWRDRTYRNAAYGSTMVFTISLLTFWGYRRVSSEEATLAKNAILLNEVHHRVKNNLAIIQSLLMLEANRVPPEARQGYEDSIARVEAMGLVHHLLYQHQTFEGINAAEYIERLCAGLQLSAGAVRIVTDLERVDVPLDTAVPMALIVNEVITNAVKHGFPGGRPGKVSVRLRLDGNRVSLTVEDDGQGFRPEENDSRPPGLGLMLVTQLTRQLGGTAGITGANGTLFALAFPWRASGPSTEFRKSIPVPGTVI